MHKCFETIGGVKQQAKSENTGVKLERNKAK